MKSGTKNTITSSSIYNCQDGNVVTDVAVCLFVCFGFIAPFLSNLMPNTLLYK